MPLHRGWFARQVALLGSMVMAASALGAEPKLETFTREIQPVLAKYCYDCHGNGLNKGGVTLDEVNSAALHDHKLWLAVLKNIRSGVMPPAEEEHPLPASEVEKIASWIKREAFGLDPAKPDPGRVTVRRLNRVEYRNTIRELTGVDFDTQKEFPADDTGHGFDNLADVLTISPMLTEKYLDAAQAIVARGVVTKPRSVAERVLHGRQFATVKVDTKIPEPPKPAEATPTAAPATTDVAATIAIPAPAASASAPASATTANAATGTRTQANPVSVASATPQAAGQATAGQPAAPGAPGRGQGRGAGRGGRNAGPPPVTRPVPTVEGDTIVMSYYTPATIAAKTRLEHSGKYQVHLDLLAQETYAENLFDLNKCQITITLNGDKLLDREFVREGYGRKFEFSFERELTSGEYEIAMEIRPLEPATPQYRKLRMRLNSVTIRGPQAEEFWVKTPGYDRFFPRAVPEGANERRDYARELLTKFATRAFRRPADPVTVEKLVALAESVSSAPTSSFEAGVAQAMVAALALPSFLFREEHTEPLQAGQAHPLIDEYSLASRLSYFLWSSMPDDELFRLASERRLRATLPAQLKRMLADARAQEFVRNFTGQWLQARDIATVAITAEAVYLRDNPNPDYEEARETFRTLQAVPAAQRTPEQLAAMQKARTAFFEFTRQTKPDLTEPLRRAMLQETEMTFAHILREDRSLLELLDSDYTFLNEPLAKHYGIEGVTGAEMRKVTLPPNSPRGGVLTQGTVLAVTSNPTRTSPVKRGVFILEAILGMPPAPPPPNIPSLEDAAPAETLKTLNLRDTLALHAKNPVCSSCHSRMDPLGLALENFNAMGMWRTADMGQPVQTAGKLVTGETFSDVRELKRVLANARRRDFYYCVSEKLLTYALGRSVEHYDTLTLDQLVGALESSGGRPSALLHGIVNAPAFQQRRASTPAAAISETSEPNSVSTQRLARTHPTP